MTKTNVVNQRNVCAVDRSWPESVLSLNNGRFWSQEPSFSTSHCIGTLRDTVNKFLCYLGNSGEGKISCLDKIIMYGCAGVWGTEGIWV